MQVETTDPITGVTIKDLENHPYIMEGMWENALKIYFENEQTKKEYLDIAVEHPGEDFTTNLDNPQKMGSED